MGIHHELMEVTMTIARSFSISPFEVMKEDAADVVMVVNHFIEKAGEGPADPRPERKQTRKKVNDKTATGGWF